MDKVKLELKIPKNKIIEHNGVEIEVTPYLTFTQQIFIINAYLDVYFGVKNESIVTPLSKYNYFEAEYTLANYIIQLTTNIDVTDASYDSMLDSHLLSKITREIYNYGDLDERLRHMVNEIKEQKNIEKSVGSVIDKAFEEVKEILSNFSNITPEDLEKVQNTASEMIQELKESAILPVDATDEILPAKKTRKHKSA